MYCTKCGTQLPDDANFCLKCGHPQHAGAAPAAADTPPEPIIRETCEIHFYSPPIIMGPQKAKIKFWANAIGPNGIYNAGFSEEFKSWSATPNNASKDQLNILNSFVQKLTANGWEPLTRGETWFGYRFQRRSTHPRYGKSC